MLCQELDGKIGHLVIELQKKKRALEQEHTETQMVQVSTLGSLGSEVTGTRTHRDPDGTGQYTRSLGSGVTGVKNH